MEDKYEKKDTYHDFYIRVSGLWQKIGAKHYNNFTSTDRFSLDVRSIKGRYEPCVAAFKGLNISNRDIEKYLGVTVTRGDETAVEGYDND